MHIIVLEREPSSKRGGQEIVLLDVCRGLAQRGYDITLLYNQEANLLEQYQEFCAYILKVNRFIIFRPQHIFSFVADLRKVIRNIPIDKDTVVLSNQFTNTTFGYALALSKNIPLFCYLHLPPPKSNLSRLDNISKVKKNLSQLNIDSQWQLGMKGVKHFIAVSNQTKLDWIKTGYQERIIDLVYNGLDLEVYTPAVDFSSIRKKWNISEDVRVISYVGRIDHVKGLETLLQAFASLVKSGLHSQLLIAGKPVLQNEDYQKSLEQLSTELGIENYVTFLGHVSNTTSVYQVSDVTVLPSLWSEAFPRSIIESMACGTPVVASRIGGIPESLSGEFQNGLFEPGNEQDLSNTLNSMINWREQDPQLGERCREHIVSKFSLDRMIDGIEKVLEKYINK